MTIDELKVVLQDAGVVGAGGAGFPSYAKLDERADTILLNCAECEPLLMLHRQCLKVHAEEILKAFELVRETVHAKEGIIGIKAEYEATIRALEEYIDKYPSLSIHKLSSSYPMGDEVVLIYEATGKTVRPGGLPIEQGVAVFNVETMYNIYRAVFENHPVTDKLVTLVGEVSDPVTVRVPLGTSLRETVSMAGSLTTKDPVYFVGGPMMGRIQDENASVTKTTNAILVLPKDHKLILKKKTEPSAGLKRAASICCQCQMCTDLCPRHALGHPIEPHLFMRAAANRDFTDLHPFLNTFFCSGCGLCEHYSCPQGLQPRTLITEYKNGLRKNGVKAPSDVEIGRVSPARDGRKAPESRLAARLGVTKYEKEAPLDDAVRRVRKVKVLLSQHIGAPAAACVQAGEYVNTGDAVALPPEKALSVRIHAPVSGRVMEVTDQYVMINGGAD
ncbi:Na+-translocating ferredoxin:NAD+ oxidoreductase RNF, RnfC subunit [Lachnospiraceae bacterium]|nr:Na+-translocating ferredoxin:NAD+ oxidoreductase RNF, RnfC subunit [Lachnospiraceae bacterium]